MGVRHTACQNPGCILGVTSSFQSTTWWTRNNWRKKGLRSRRKSLTWTLVRHCAPGQAEVEASGHDRDVLQRIVLLPRQPCLQRQVVPLGRPRRRTSFILASGFVRLPHWTQFWEWPCLHRYILNRSFTRYVPFMYVFLCVYKYCFLFAVIRYCQRGKCNHFHLFLIWKRWFCCQSRHFW